MGPSATLWPAGFVAGAAAAGLVVGLRVWRRDSRALGAVVAVPNGLVLALYGFFLSLLRAGRQPAGVRPRPIQDPPTPGAP